MADKAEKPNDKPAEPKLVKGIIMEDGVWSSQGKHAKGDEWGGTEEDAKVLEERKFLKRT